MQFKQKIMKQIISLSIVSIAFDTAEMRRMNRALGDRIMQIIQIFLRIMHISRLKYNS